MNKRLTHVVNTRLTEAELSALQALAERPGEPVAHILRRIVQAAVRPPAAQRSKMTTTWTTADQVRGVFTSNHPGVTHGVLPGIVLSGEPW